MKDNAWGCYTTLFSNGNSWSYNLSKIAATYKDYESLMEHWHSILPMDILDLNYESLVTDPKRYIPKILEFCELPFHNNCIEFYKHVKTVHTASMAQVRKPIDSRYLGKWKNYEKFLGVLDGSKR